jgi:dihydroorotase
VKKFFIFQSTERIAMIEIRNVQTVNGHRIDHWIKSQTNLCIDAGHLTLLPALIDPHVHFRVPGAEYKETWESGALAAIAGGVTTVLDMPNNTPACCTNERLREKIALVEAQLKNVQIPLRYGLYFGADPRHLDEIAADKGQIIGLKIYMGSSTGDLLMNDRASLDEAFRLAKKYDILVAVHAEDEQLIQLNRQKYKDRTDAAAHSLIRSPSVAAHAVRLAIDLAKRHEVRLYIVHTSTAEELALIRQAKKEEFPVYAEAAPHHLFLNALHYSHLGTKALVNPPLREKEDVQALWEAIEDGTIDTIGTDHAPHTLEEKGKPFGAAPSGFPSIELYLALLLNAHSQGKISLGSIVSLTHTRPQEIFRLPLNDDVVLVDLNKTKTVDNKHLKTKVKWSPYEGAQLQGWPRYTILQGQLFDLEKL